MAFLVVWLTVVFLAWWFLANNMSRLRTQNRRRSRPLRRSSPPPLPIDVPAGLERKLVRLLRGDRAAAHRLVTSIRHHHPQESLHWCWEKAIWDLERDRFR